MSYHTFTSTLARGLAACFVCAALGGVHVRAQEQAPPYTVDPGAAYALEPGEKVVVAGQEKLKDGMGVRIAKPSKAPGKPAATTSGPVGRGGGAS